VTGKGPTANPTAFERNTLILDKARDNLQPKIGASVTTMTRDNIERLPGGDETPVDKAILQFPGVSYDSGRQQSELPRAQRVCEHADPHQRHPPARRRVRPS
jgi:hypothetical protein